MITQKADADSSYHAATAKLEEQLLVALNVVKVNDKNIDALNATAARLKEELAMSCSTNSTHVQTITALREKVLLVQSESCLLEGRLLTMQHRFDESVFNAQRYEEKVATTEAASAATQKTFDALQKKHVGLLNAIASETSLKRKREQKANESIHEAVGTTSAASGRGGLHSDGSSDGRSYPSEGSGSFDARHRTLSLASSGSKSADEQRLNKYSNLASRPTAETVGRGQGPGTIGKAMKTVVKPTFSATGASGPSSFASSADSGKMNGGPVVASSASVLGYTGSTSRGGTSGKGGSGIYDERSAGIRTYNGSPDCIELSPLDDDMPIQTLKKPRPGIRLTSF